MMKEKIALLKCEDYNVDLIERTIRQGFELLGGDEFIRKLIPINSKVLLKPNLLCAEQRGSIVITHYKVFEAVIRVLKDYTNTISYGDSPGFGNPFKISEKSGLAEVANKYGVEYKDFNDKIHIVDKDCLLVKSWDISKDAYESDVLITLPKLKTHGMAYYTGAVKNQFGCIPGPQKAIWHTRTSTIDNFSKMLLDLNKVVGTSFAILDGITAMEGNGPRSGTPKKMNSIIMGESITAVDSTAVRLIGYDNPLDIPQLKIAHELNWGTVLPEEIKILGNSIDEMKADKFQLIRKGREYSIRNEKIAKVIKSIIAPYPKLIKSKCIGCRRCEEICPEKPKVIKMIEKNNKLLPEFKMDQCIRCFCCQELCPEGALKVGETFLGKLFN